MDIHAVQGTRCGKRSGVGRREESATSQLDGVARAAWKCGEEPMEPLCEHLRRAELRQRLRRKLKEDRSGLCAEALEAGPHHCVAGITRVEAEGVRLAGAPAVAGVTREAGQGQRLVCLYQEPKILGDRCGVGGELGSADRPIEAAIDADATQKGMPRIRGEPEVCEALGRRPIPIDDSSPAREGPRGRAEAKASREPLGEARDFGAKGYGPDRNAAAIGLPGAGEKFELRIPAPIRHAPECARGVWKTRAQEGSSRAGAACAGEAGPAAALSPPTRADRKVRSALILEEPMAYKTLEVRVEGALVWLMLNRPEALNAMNLTLVGELRDFFSSLPSQQELRVVVLRGAGRAFCAGLDLRESGAEPRGGVPAGLRAQRRISELALLMRRAPQPIIACVQGAACGGGFALALASDVRIAGESARMNAAFIRIGLSACDVGVSYFLPRLVGASVAAELLLTGRFIHAERARSLGLVSAVVPDAELEAEARKLAEEMLGTSPLGLRLTKECLNASLDAGSLEQVVAMEDRNQILCAQTRDFGEGVRAFLEKRRAEYADG